MRLMERTRCRYEPRPGPGKKTGISILILWIARQPLHNEVRASAKQRAWARPIMDGMRCYCEAGWASGNGGGLVPTTQVRSRSVTGC